jgi:hypothetical protein
MRKARAGPPPAVVSRWCLDQIEFEAGRLSGPRAALLGRRHQKIVEQGPVVNRRLPEILGRGLTNIEFFMSSLAVEQLAFGLGRAPVFLDGRESVGSTRRCPEGRSQNNWRRTARG